MAPFPPAVELGLAELLLLLSTKDWMDVLEPMLIAEGVVLDGVDVVVAGFTSCEAPIVPDAAVC